jgi:hypothetical protein
VELPPALFEDVTGQPAYTPNPWPDERPIPSWVFLGQRATVLRNNEPTRLGIATAPAARIGRVSILGVGLVHDHPIPVGEVFTLVLPRRSGRPPLPVLCTCTRCEETDLGQSRIGAVFTALPQTAPEALAA